MTCFTYIVYDKDLNKVFDYTNPNYDGYDFENAFRLANGSILAQYSIQLDQDATELDYRECSDEKYALVTVIAEGYERNAKTDTLETKIYKLTITK